MVPRGLIKRIEILEAKVEALMIKKAAVPGAPTGLRVETDVPVSKAKIPKAGGKSVLRKAASKKKK